MAGRKDEELKVIKAIFMDFYGTVAHENGPIAMEVVQRIYKNSNARYIPLLMTVS